MHKRQQELLIRRASLQRFSSHFSFLWILLSIFFAACASMFNKKAAMVGKGGDILTSLLTPWYLAVLVCLVLLACVWIMALRYHPLSFAYPFMSAVRGIVLFGAWFFFHEQVHFQEVLGMLILMSGIVLIGISRKS